eukprot:TRINITY_DN11624_c0_g1_i3.p1 TRINITY_DN11624_c0_g1~~TRINITY_DN11624_c0_g1_i3.p1  ORF type:complete len:442 (-),score=113.92 TRINITY_DN11624_c0_g1_i3:58-1350(-)
MGNDVVIPPAAKSKFDEYELKDLVDKYTKTAKNPKLGIDEKTWVSTYLTNYPIISARLFAALRSPNSKVKAILFDEFATGMAVCKKGPKSAQIQQIYWIFDKGSKGFLTKDDFKDILKESCFEPIMTGKGDTAIAAVIDDIFLAADLNQDGKIDPKEFLQWGNSSDVCAIILDLFADIKVGVSPYAVSAPRNFKAVTHVGFNPQTGAFEVNNLPKEWKKLLKEAGISKKEAQNPEVTKLVLNIVAENLSGTSDSGSLPTPTPSTGTTAPTESDKTLISRPSRDSLRPQKPAPPPPLNTTNTSNTSTSTPSPPPPPPPPINTTNSTPESSLPPPSQTSDGGGSSLLAGIKAQKDQLTHTTVEEKTVTGKRSFLDDIKTGAASSLKKVEIQDISKIDKQQLSGLAGVLSKAINERRTQMKEEYESDDSEWSD